MLQGSASEATLVALLGAKSKIMTEEKEKRSYADDYEIVKKLVAYTSGELASTILMEGY